MKNKGWAAAAAAVMMVCLASGVPAESAWATPGEAQRVSAPETPEEAQRVSVPETPEEAQGTDAQEQVQTESRDAQVTLIVPETTAIPVPENIRDEGFRLGDRILIRGMEGTDVAELQALLLSLGYDVGEVDGKLGRQTVRAIRDFQRRNELEKVDGKAGPITIEHLRSETAVGRPTPVPTATPVPTSSPAPTPTPEPTPEPTPVPDVREAPFEVEERGVQLSGEVSHLLVGRGTNGEPLYPLSEVLRPYGYSPRREGQVFTFRREAPASEITLEAKTVRGLSDYTIGAVDGVLFLTDEQAQMYVWNDELFVNAEFMRRIGYLVRELPENLEIEKAR